MKNQYYTYKGITRNGPYTLDELKKHIIYADSKIWKEGSDDWAPASEFQELQELIQIKPPSRIKPFSYFMKNTSELKLKATLVITISVYLFTSLFLNGGLETLMFKYNHGKAPVNPIQAMKPSPGEIMMDTIPQNPSEQGYRELDSSKSTTMSEFLKEINKGVDSLTPSPNSAFKVQQRKNTPNTLRIIDANKYREYIPDFDPDDPNLDRLLSSKLNSIISNAFYGPITILITIVTFGIAIILNNFKYEDFRAYLNQFRDIVK